MRKFLQLLLTILLLAVTAIVLFAVWSYRVKGTLPFQLPGLPQSALYTPTPTITPTPTPTPVMGKAVIATRPIAVGEKLGKENLKLAPIPQSEIPDGATADPRVLYGLLARRPISAGEVVTTKMAVPPGKVFGEGSLLAQMLKPGQVAIALPVKGALATVGYAPRAGDLVDIVVTFTFVNLDQDFQTKLPNRVLVLGENVENHTYAFYPAAELGKLAKEDPAIAVPVYVIPAKGQRPRMVAQLTIQNARVLYFGHDLWPKTPVPTPEKTPRPAPKPTATPGPQKPDTMVLAVSPQDAVVLNYFIKRHALITLTLGSALGGHEQPLQTVPVTLDYIVQNFGVPASAPFSSQLQGKKP